MYSKKFPTGRKPIPYAYLKLLAVYILLCSFKGFFGGNLENHRPMVLGVLIALHRLCRFPLGLG